MITPLNNGRTVGAKSLRTVETENNHRVVEKAVEIFNTLNVNHFNTIPADVLNVIIRYLPDLSLSNLERTEKKFYFKDLETGRDLTGLEWAQRKKEVFLDFQYGGCEKEIQRNKCEYFISRKIDEFMLKDQFFGRTDNDSLTKLEDKYFPVYFRFPFLENFFKKASRIAPNDFFLNGAFDHTRLLPYLQQEAADKAFNEAYSKNGAGELMLKGMILSKPQFVNDQTLNTLSICFNAISKNATCLSLYSKYTIDANSQLILAMQAAKHGDERGIFSFLSNNINFVDNIPKEEQESIPTISFLKSLQLIENGDIDEGEKLIEKTLSLKLPIIPISVTDFEDYTLQILRLLEGKNELKENILSILFKISHGNIPNTSLFYLIHLKNNLAKFTEAEGLLNSMISNLNNETPPNILEDAACIKFNFKEFDSVVKLMEQAITAYGANVPAKSYDRLAAAKFKLNKFNEAENLFEKAITGYGNNVPATAYRNLAFTKCRLKKTVEAEKLFEQAIIEFKTKVPANTYHDLALIKIELNKFVEAENLFENAIIGYKNNVPASTYNDLALTKFKLKKFVEAENLYEQAISVGGDNFPLSVYKDLAITKLQLNKPVEAENLLEKATIAYGANVPLQTYLTLIKVKSQLNKITDALQILELAKQAYETKASPQFFQKLYARIKKESIKVDEVDRKKDQAENTL